MASELVYANYLDDFQCKCGSCRRTCCTGRDWRIAMTAEELAEAYNCAVDASLAGILPDEASEAAEGGSHEYPLPLDSTTSQCVFLAEDGLCGWRAHTASDLCMICQDFPTAYSHVLGIDYAVPSGACEAVLETLIAYDQPICLKTRQGEAEERHLYSYRLTEDGVSAQPLGEIYPFLARLGVEVLQLNTMPLDHRVGALTQLLDVALRMAKIGQTALIESALEPMTSEPALASLVAGYGDESQVGNPAVRICAELYSSCLMSDSYESLARRILEALGFGIVSDGPKRKPKALLLDPELLMKKRAAADKLLQEREEFLAKVLVSIYLHSGIPLAAPDPWSNVRYFVVCYAVLKFGLAGAFEGDPTDEELVDVLVELLRAFTHNGDFYRNVLGWLNGIGYKNADDVVKTALW